MRGADGIELINYAVLATTPYLPGADGAIQTSSFRILEPAVTEHLRSALARMKPNTNLSLASLPAFSAFTTLIELPKMSEKELEQSIPFQSQQYIPAPLSTVEIQWFPIGERTDENGTLVSQVFLMSVAKSLIEKYKRIFKSAGLRLDDLEVESLSLARVFSVDVPEPILIIDIGSRSTSFTIAEDGVLKFVSQTDCAGGSLTQVLSASLGITPRRAEELKIQKGLLGEGGEQGLSTLMTPMLDVIISEAGRALDSFRKSYGKKAARALLSGGGANLLGLADYFALGLGMPVSLAEPFSKVRYSPDLAPFVSALGPRFAVVIGAALKHL